MNFVVATLKKGPNGLIEDFRKMKRTNDFTKMTEFVQQNAKGKNRYKDVGCLDNNRVILTMGNCPYIHANYVSTPENPKRFICTQAPLPATCEDFWYMVVQESSEVIIMLCNFIEQLQFPFETPIKIEVTHLEVTVGGQTHPCTHYHWVDWPDRCVPAADSAPLYLLNLFAKIKTPIVIHCSAGIGRTGSMVLLQNAMEVLLRGEVLNEMNVYLEEVRKQRNNSVQTDQQYLYVHQVLLMYLRTAAYLPDSILAGLDAFTAAYNTATSGF
ncbi:unnamed protein product [Nippostrongylus brasiliensis]|uniref:Protein-tyrosine phosphatase n=1 Tax=Nippostrongylus brasiliensis TaxID=27835 RepID=A0A0N4XZ48_NIPBR|nr:unnamed protein product [Nippostrongylus brasiliensis]